MTKLTEGDIRALASRIAYALFEKYAVNTKDGCDADDQAVVNLVVREVKEFFA